jgi:hypothetical protein
MRDDDVAAPSVTRLYPRQKQAPARRDAAESGEIISLSKYEFAQFFAPGSPYRKGIQDRATRIRKYAEALERTALIGSNGALDLLDVAALRPLERAIREHEELIAFGRETGLIGRGQP